MAGPLPKWLDMAMQVRETKNFPWPNASNVKFPLLTVAAIQFQARAYPAIVDGSNLVKGRVLGPDPQGEKRERADRIGAHMTWQLLYRMPGWEEETDRLLLMLPIVGCVFRKTYFDSIANSNVLGDGVRRGLHHQLLGQEPGARAALHAPPAFLSA
jgi:chaperonin GroES